MGLVLLALPMPICSVNPIEIISWVGQVGPLVPWCNHGVKPYTGVGKSKSTAATPNCNRKWCFWFNVCGAPVRGSGDLTVTNHKWKVNTNKPLPCMLRKAARQQNFRVSFSNLPKCTRVGTRAGHRNAL